MSATSNPAVIQPISSSLSQLLFLFLINAFTVAPKMRAPAIIDNIIFFLLLLLFQREFSFFVHFSATTEKCVDDFCHQDPCDIKHFFVLSLFSCYRRHCHSLFSYTQDSKNYGSLFLFFFNFQSAPVFRVRFSSYSRFYHLAFVFFTSIYARFRKIWECNFIFCGNTYSKDWNWHQPSVFQRLPNNALTTSVIRIHVTSNICSSFRLSCFYWHCCLCS